VLKSSDSEDGGTVAYASTIDERYGGYLIGSSAGARDAPSILNSIYVVKEGGLAYGTLTYNNSILDQDVYSLGILNTGYYKVDVNDQTWDYSNYDSASVTSFYVLNSIGNIVGTSYGSYADINFTVNSADTYYVKLTGAYYSSAQYTLSYTKTGELTNSPAVFGEATYSGSPIVGNYIGAATTYYDANGNSDNSVGIGWYLNGVYSGFTGSAETFLLLPEYVGKTLSFRFSFNDDLGNFEISNYYIVGPVLAPADTTAPTVSTFSPTDGATGVAVASNIVVTFSETIARGTGNIELRAGSATGTIVETFDAASSTRLTLSNNQLTIDPTSNLSNSTQYFVVMASGTIKDGAGNNYTGTSTYDFTTVAAGPTEGNDNLVGTASNETINGLGGNDTISGLGGNDTLVGGLGNDILDGGAGNDVLTGGDGTDTASYVSATAGVTVSLALTTAQNTVGAGSDTLTTIENLSGSGFNDTLTGSSSANTINGGAGNDVINGGGGIDTLDGGQGSDVYLVTLLADKTAAEITDTGTSGTDELRFAATTAGTLTLSAGDTGLESVVIGTGTGASAATTGKVALNVNATASSNGLSITGNAGANTLTGSGFADTLDGGAGNDVLVGGIGADTLIGGLGRDTLTGGVGADIFKFSLVGDSGTTATASDVITDFVRGEDRIDLSAIDAFLASKNVNDTFIWQGTAAFSNTTQGEVRYQKFDVAGTANDHTMVWIDNDADTVVEIAIRLTGLHDLAATDFIL
jgi:Ca2+-binding RTX toxin-like protein